MCWIHRKERIFDVIPRDDRCDGSHGWWDTLSCLADVDDGGAELLGLGWTDAGDGLKLRDRTRALQNDAAQRGGAEDEELRQADALGLGFAPGAKLRVEDLLVGCEVGCGIGGGRTRAVEGQAFVRMRGSVRWMRGMLGVGGGERLLSSG